MDYNLRFNKKSDGRIEVTDSLETEIGLIDTIRISTFVVINEITGEEIHLTSETLREIADYLDMLESMNEN